MVMYVSSDSVKHATEIKHMSKQFSKKQVTNEKDTKDILQNRIFLPGTC